jgi:hypothetical protein
MKLLSASFLLILLTCAFLINRVSGGEKLPSENPSREAKQTNDPDAKEAAPNNRTTSPEFKSRSAVNEPATNREKTDSKKTTNETGYFDFLWATEMPNWISILGWIIAAIVAWWSLGAVYRQADIADEGVKVAHAATKAARESAEIANKALQADRPYLLIENITLSGFNPPSDLGLVWAIIIVKTMAKALR